MRSDTEKPITATMILHAVRSFSFSAVFGGAIEWLLSTYKKLLNYVDPEPVPLPADDHASLEKLLAPATQELEALRRSTVKMVDNRARILVPLAAIAVLLLTNSGKGDASVGPVFAVIAAVTTFVAISYRPAARYANAVKSQYGAIMQIGCPASALSPRLISTPKNLRHGICFPTCSKERSLTA